MITYGKSSYFINTYGKLNQSDITEFVFKFIPDYLDTESCKSLSNLEKPSTDKLKRGSGLFTDSDTYRKSDIFFINEDQLNNNVVYQKIVQQFVYFNDKYFQADITDFMQMQYTYYDGAGEHFNWHPDGCFSYEKKDNVVVDKSVAFRKMTVALCLSDESEYEGGEFLLIDPFVDPSRAIASFKMTAGEAVMFPAFLFHKVNPIISGTRKSIVLWGCGPKWR